ncbi:MAG: DUF58 domain-containing protein [Planctomycetaceae bacterium]|jgi:uncharacterized protein (DUF58 family)|nr:DUF58 domain-containing protein [Planctomycetaceae bacterium]
MKQSEYFHPDILKQISRLDLRAKYVVDGFLSGTHKSRHFGNSVEFRQHRQYVPGDDLRSVDWKVWAKQDRLYVKQYEIDTNMRVTLLIDKSQSMRFGSRAMNKYDYACTIAASLAYLAIRQQDAVGCITFDNDTQNVLPSKMKWSQLAAIADRMFRSAPDSKIDAQKTKIENNNIQKTETEKNAVRKNEISELIDLNELLKDIKSSQPDFQEVLRIAAETVRANGLIVLISDLLIQREGLFRGLRYLRSYGHDVLVLHVLDDMELDFTFGGPTRFEGLELPVQIRCDPRMLRQGYLDALNIYLEEVKQGCTKLQCDYALFRTGTPLDAALSTYLSRRNTLVRNGK